MPMPMCTFTQAFLVEWVRDGGRSGQKKGFNVERLQPYSSYLTYTPPRRNDVRASRGLA